MGWTHWGIGMLMALLLEGGPVGCNLLTPTAPYQRHSSPEKWVGVVSHVSIYESKQGMLVECGRACSLTVESGPAVVAPGLGQPILLTRKDGRVLDASALPEGMRVQVTGIVGCPAPLVPDGSSLVWTVPNGSSISLTREIAAWHPQQ